VPGERVVPAKATTSGGQNGQPLVPARTYGVLPSSCQSANRQGPNGRNAYRHGYTLFFFYAGRSCQSPNSRGPEATGAQRASYSLPFTLASDRETTLPPGGSPFAVHGTPIIINGGITIPPAMVVVPGKYNVGAPAPIGAGHCRIGRVAQTTSGVFWRRVLQLLLKNPLEGRYYISVPSPECHGQVTIRP